MKTYFIILITLISFNTAFSQNLVLESDIQIQRFGKEIYYKDKNNIPLNGHYKIADSRGNYSDLIFKNGKKHGKNTDYDYQGRVIKTTTYKNGKNIGKYKTYHQNGKKQTVGIFINGDKNGKWEYFNNKGKTTNIEHFKFGKKTGKWEDFDKNGEPTRIEYYLNDQKTGKWWRRNYFPQYQYYTYEIEHFEKNQHVGHAEEKKEDGNLRWQRTYINNRTYTHKSYHENGKLAEMYHLKDGQKDQERILYNLNGTIYKQEFYKNGRLIKSVKTTEKPREKTSVKVTRANQAQETSINKKITDFNYKALLISNEKYTNDITELSFPTDDAENLINVLQTKYSFEKNNIIHLKDATRSNIINTLDSLAENITSKDNLLIFYAGHGVFDETLKKGYWIPVDASFKKDNWVSNSDIRDYISAIQSQHTLLISDACFSGSIFEYNQRKLNPRGESITEKLINKKSRKAMTSGLNKTVPDKSIFIKYLLKTLNDNQKPYLRAGELYNDIREAVMANTDNNPQFEVIKNAHHEGGEFIFLKKDE